MAAGGRVGSYGSFDIFTCLPVPATSRTSTRCWNGPFGEGAEPGGRSKKGFRLLGIYVAGRGVVYAANRSSDLASLKGMKIRTIESPVVVATWKALGTIPTPRADARGVHRHPAGEWWTAGKGTSSATTT